MTEPEVMIARYLALGALAMLLVGRALVSLLRRARARAAAPARVDEVVDVAHEERARPTSRAAPRRMHEDLTPPTEGSTRDLRAAIVTMEILGPPRAYDPRAIAGGSLSPLRGTSRRRSPVR